MDDLCRRSLNAPRLSREEERALARRARAGDRTARDALVTASMRSVVLRALMLGAGADRLSDAVQAGAVGLLEAVDRFDPERGVRLATYAWARVGDRIVTELHRARPPIELEHDVVATATSDVDTWLEGLGALRRDVVRLRHGLADGASPLTLQGVADALGLTVARVRREEGEAMRQLREGVGRVTARAKE